MGILKEEIWLDFEVLKKQLPKLPLYSLTEKCESLGLIEVKRVYDQKLKKKFANFITINDVKEPIPKLTNKQEDAWQAIKSKNSSFPLALIADQFSYAIIKALRNKNLISITAKEVTSEEKTDLSQQVIPKKIILTAEQENAIKTISENIGNRVFQTYLLYGVTGSGKTEVYLDLIKKVLSQEQTALVLVPEIALTPQMEERFFGVFGEKIAILHSHRNDRERWDEWRRIKEGRCRIVLGARSAIFAPLQNIGIIIVDEEHESSYKQENSPRYNARDLAVLRGKMVDATVVLGSATPSMESWQNVQTSKYQKITLSSRPHNYNMPVVNIVDLKDEDHNTLISDQLKEKILNRLEKKEQIILLQNRRGFASFVICTACGHIHKCPKCDISLIYHSSDHRLVCHYCGHSETMIRKCPDCGSYILEYGTAGTQQLEKQLKILFPKASMLRMDADTVTRKDSYASMFRRMREGSVDILFGTQMIAKGLDFAKVTLVGVISADNSLNIPDYRSSERTFQLLTQVAGRSGRGDYAGEVVIQTYNPDHYAVSSALEQDFSKFARTEMELREVLFYPPYAKIVRVLFSHKNEEFLAAEMIKIKPLTGKILQFYCNPAQANKSDGKSQSVRILGPVPAPVHRINDRFRYHLIVKTTSVTELQHIVSYLISNMKISKSIKIDTDIDPASLL
jgi:primosomal protein N' (replication factor Y) (superfamily II helicase)